MELPQVELTVRLTARVSAAAFSAALLLFAVGYRRRRLRYGTRLFVAFVLAHTIHFGAVAWLAWLTAGENIQRRGGWAVVSVVAVLFYLAAFGILRAWRNLGSDRLPSRSDQLMASLGVVFVGVVFLNSYLGRVGSMPVYWLPAICMVAVVAAYLLRLRGAATRVGSAAAAPLR